MFKFTSKIINNKPDKRVETNNKRKQVKVVKVSSSILPKPSKEDSNIKSKHSYTQTLASKIKKILKLKESFSNLLSKKIKDIDIYNMIYDFGKVKPRISMTTKGLSRRQINTLISNDYILNFIKSFGSYITNLNSIFKNIKLEIVAEFVQSDQYRIIITTNKITLLSNLYIIENYIRNTNISFPLIFYNQNPT